MRSTAIAVMALTLASSAMGFKDTSPLLIWSAKPNTALREAASEITTGVIGADDVYSSLSTLGCDWRSVAVIQVDDLHQSHLPSLGLPSKVGLHVPYLVRPSREALETSLAEWGQVCGAQVKTRSSPVVGDDKQIVRLTSSKKGESLRALRKTIGKLPEHDLLIVAGTRKLSPLKSQEHQELKRQEWPFPSDPTETESATASSTATSSPEESTSSAPTPDRDSTIPTDGPLLERVQILTTPVITGLLLSFGVLLPILYVAVSALAGIQVPPRMMEIGKSLSVTKDRKDQ